MTRNSPATRLTHRKVKGDFVVTRPALVPHGERSLMDFERETAKDLRILQNDEPDQLEIEEFITSLIEESIQTGDT
jgi:hypothetical protein